jgi:hypothetical protein
MTSFTPRLLSSYGIHWFGGWVGPRAGLPAEQAKGVLPLTEIEPRFLGRPLRSPSLYRLSYPGSYGILKRCEQLRYVCNQTEDTRT